MLTFLTVCVPFYKHKVVLIHLYRSTNPSFYLNFELSPFLLDALISLLSLQADVHNEVIMIDGADLRSVRRKYNMNSALKAWFIGVMMGLCVIIKVCVAHTIYIIYRENCCFSEVAL